jgi:hypothetical protein
MTLIPTHEDIRVTSIQDLCPSALSSGPKGTVRRFLTGARRGISAAVGRNQTVVFSVPGWMMEAFGRPR